VSLGDDIVGALALTPSDGVSLGDDIVGALALMPSDEVSLGDDIVGALALTPSDGVVLGDSSLATALVVVLSDGVLLGDTWIAEMPLTDGVYVTDSKRLGELTMGERLGADWLSMTITHPETDGIIAGDDRTMALPLADGVSLGDTWVAEMALADGAVLSDDPAISLVLVPVDGVTLGDDPVMALVVVLADGVTLGDTWVAEMALTDGVYVTDSKRLGEITMGERLGADRLSMTITHPETDGIITGDERTMALSLAADGVKLGDDIAGTLALVPIDGVDLGDDIAGTLALVPIDGVDLGDDIAGTLALVPIDGVDLGDDIAGTLALVPIDGVELGDDIAGTLALVPTDGVELGDAASNRILPVLTLVLESASQSAAPSIVVYLVQYDVYPALLFVIEYDPILYDDDGEYTVYLRARARDAAAVAVNRQVLSVNKARSPKNSPAWISLIRLPSVSLRRIHPFLTI